MAVEELENFRAQYPQYGDMGDAELADSLAAKFPAYKDLPGKVGTLPRITEKIGKLTPEPIKNLGTTLKEAMPPLPSVSMPSMETVKSYLTSFTGTRPAPTPKPPTELNPQFKVDDMGNVFDQASGKNILEQGPQAPQAPIIQPPPAPGLL